MSKHNVAVVIGLCMTVAIGLLWRRVEQLENRVASLKQQLNARPKVVTAVAPALPELRKAEGESVFKLLNTAKPNNLDDGETDVGVPWSIERGMLLDGIERNSRPENSRPLIDERPMDGPPNRPIDLLNEAPK
ncbi:MAG TPA: hypothetical protein VHK01_14395 [Lacipirellulaceae bacterium]|jgi:hypothetical protein|nr:hypothetical protein [Lacipirellulaceae bacterium]